MRQVPALTTYLLVGDGRMARHAAHYLGLESLPFSTWSRSENRDTLVERAKNCSHVLVLITDGAIESFLHENEFLRSRICVHFSGALSTPMAAGAHPLMTFAGELYSVDEYRSIPFVLERGRGSMNELLPGLSNTSFEIDPENKGLYHAYCAMAGGFTVLAWEKAFREFEAKLGLPRTTLFPYLERITKNLETTRGESSVLTGPLARGDRSTIDAHLAALGTDPFADVYRAFASAFESNRGFKEPRGGTT